MHTTCVGQISFILGRALCVRVVGLTPSDNFWNSRRGQTVSQSLQTQHSWQPIISLLSVFYRKCLTQKVYFNILPTDLIQIWKFISYCVLYAKLILIWFIRMSDGHFKNTSKMKTFMKRIFFNSIQISSYYCHEWLLYCDILEWATHLFEWHI